MVAGGVVLASSSLGEHGSQLGRGGAAPVFLVLQLNEASHMDSENDGMQN